MLRLLKQPQPHLKSTVVICTYQDSISTIIKQSEKFIKLTDVFVSEKTYIMDNITDSQEIFDLIKNNLPKRDMIVRKIAQEVIEILIKKSYKGNPLFMLDIFDSFVNTRLCNIVNYSQLNTKTTRWVDQGRYIKVGQRALMTSLRGNSLFLKL